MKKKNNSGFSIVEILIALAIFLILMIPIVKGIVQALNMSTGSKELQYRNEFAEGIMEHVKSAPIDEILSEKYYLDAGTDASTLKTSKELHVLDDEADGYVGPPLTNDFDGNGITSDEIFEYGKYQISGEVKLGTKHQDYVYLVDVDSYDYAYKKSQDDPNVHDENDFLDPNNMAMGIVEDVDHTKVFLVDDQVFNYDRMAENTFKAKKIQNLKEFGDPDDYQQAISNTANYFAGQPGYRLMTIKISGSKSAGYNIKCILDYYDPADELGADSEDHYLEYYPYGQNYEKKIPNIYINYNPCHYNGNYATDDYVAVDISDLENKKEDINIFLVEVTTKYSQNIVDADTITAVNSADPESDAVFDNDQVLFNESFEWSGHERKDTTVHLGSVTGSKCDLNKVHLFTNIGDNLNDDNSDKRNLKTDMSHFEHNKIPAGTFRDLIFVMIDNNKENVTSGFVGQMTSDNHPEDFAEVGFLHDATEEARGMYKVKVYLKKKTSAGDKIDPTKDKPILEGTKGGNES